MQNLYKIKPTWSKIIIGIKVVRIHRKYRYNMYYAGKLCQWFMSIFIMYLAKQHIIQHFKKFMQNTIEICATLLNVAFADRMTANYKLPTIVE